MNYEKKLTLAKEALESGSYDKETIEYIFPELKESDNERIRKTLIEYFNTYPKDYYGELKKSDILSFLKKQKPINDTDDDIVEAVKDSSVLDLVEPLNQYVLRLKKFKQGEWIVWKDKHYKVNYNGCGYELFDQNGLSTSWDYKTIEDNAHLWTIQDAKDGDVLAMVIDDYLSPFIAIYKNGGLDFFNSYCLIGLDGRFYKGAKGHTTDNIHPATKEQQDLLFQKMKEAGYEWDADKKELKKIEIITPLFNVGDTIIKKHNSDINDFGQFTITDITGGKYWYNDRIICDITEQDEWEFYEPVRQETAWSEDDEETLGWLCTFLKEYGNEFYDGNEENVIDWLKSLKDKVQSKWKPNEEQISMLEDAINYLDSIGSETSKTILEDLLEQLKKL